jgi:hypothetical protein
MSFFGEIIGEIVIEGFIRPLFSLIFGSIWAGCMWIIHLGRKPFTLFFHKEMAGVWGFFISIIFICAIVLIS